MKTSVHKIRHNFKKHQIRVGRLLAGLGLPEYLILIIFSVVMGIAAGFAGVGLHKLIQLLSGVAFEAGSWGNSIGMLIILIPTIGMLIQSLMTTLAPKQAGQRGVIEIIKSVGLHCGRVPFRTTLFHFLAPAICIGSGGTVGPEAPAAQSGAGLVSAIGRMMGLAEHRQRVFTAAGAGAAIAAIFNAPLAGVFFAIEVVLLQDLKASALSALLLASVSASAVSRIILGNEPAFTIGMVHLGSYQTYIFYFFMGIGAGLLSMAFIRSNEWIKWGCQRMNKKVPKWIGMAGVGLLMGLAGYWQPGIFGVGYDSMNQILADTLTSQTVLTLLFLKFFLVSLILGVGGFGGVFAPSLFLGACYGYLFATGIAFFFGLHLDTTTYTLVGMGAVLAGINSVPLTAIMMLFEMTTDYHFILPLMLGVVGGTLIVQMSLKGSIYERALKHQGFHYAMGRDTRILESIAVAEVMRKEILTVAENASLVELIQKCLSHPHDIFYTTNRKGQINGVIPSSNLHQLITEYQDLKSVAVARDLADPSVPLLKENDNLDHAMRVFANYRVEEIPVVNSDSNANVLGVVHYQDVLKAYNDAKIKLNLADGLAGDLRMLNADERHDVLPGFAIMDVLIPEDFINKTLKELRLRNRFAVDVLMIEKDGGPFAANEHDTKRIFPQTNYRFSGGDRLIIFGKNEKVEAFRDYSKNQ